MNQFEKALIAYSQFEKDVKKARDQYEELSEMYIVYKDIEELSLRIMRLRLRADYTNEGKRRFLQSEINVLQDNLKDKNNEFDERYDYVLDVVWPVMGEAYIEYMDGQGFHIRELEHIYEIVTEEAEMPEKPEKIV